MATAPKAKPLTIANVWARLDSIEAAIKTIVPAPAPPPKVEVPTYHSWNTTDTIVRPEFKPAMWCWYPLYMDLPTKRSDLTTIYGIPPENIRALARACRDGGTIDYQGIEYLFVAGAPVILDFETWYEGHGLDMAAAMTVFRDYVRVFRAEYPGAKIGIYGLTWAPKPDVDSNSFLAGLTADEEALIVASLKITRILLDECDFIVPSCYLYGPAANVDQDCAVYAANIRLARKLFGKPVIPFIWASYMSGTALEPEAAAKLWAMTETGCDGRIIWGNDFPLTQRLFGPLARGK